MDISKASLKTIMAALEQHHVLLEKLRTSGRTEHAEAVEAVSCLHAYNGARRAAERAK